MKLIKFDLLKIIANTVGCKDSSLKLRGIMKIQGQNLFTLASAGTANQVLKDDVQVVWDKIKKCKTQEQIDQLKPECDKVGIHIATVE
jgi:hypothetical protein